MSEHDGNRPESKEIRTSLVDTGWSEVPPPIKAPVSEVNPVEAPPALAEAPAPHEVYEAARERARDLPRYEASSEDEERDSDRVFHEDATKRIAYAALLGGAAARRGGPTATGEEVHEQPTLVGYNPLDDDEARELLKAARRAVAAPSGAEPAGVAPLPAFPSAAEQEAVSDAERDASTPTLEVVTEVKQPESAAALAAFEAAAKVFKAESHQVPSALDVASRSTGGLPAYGFDDGDLTVRAVVKMPPEMFPEAAQPNASGPVLEPPAVSEPEPAPVQPSKPVAAVLESEASAFVASADAEIERRVSPVQLERQSATPGLPDTAFQSSSKAALPLGAALMQRVRLFGLGWPAWLLSALTTLLACATVVLVFPRGTEQVTGPAPIESVSAAGSVTTKAPTKERSPSVSERAAAGDLDALRKLTSVPEQKRSIADAVAVAKGSAALAARDVQVIRAKLKQDREFAKSDQAKERLFDYVADPRIAPEALVVISELPSPLGPDLLYEIWTGTKKSTATTRLARELLYKPGVRAGASEALNVALDLRAEPACADIPAILPRAEQAGDWRALHLLGRLLLPRGCGQDSQTDCFPCLRDAETRTKINLAIKAARGRRRPKL